MTDPSAVVTLGEAEAHLNIGSMVHDDELTRFIDAATTMCESWTGRSLRLRTVSGELHDGGRATLLLRQTPVASVTTVVEDAVTASGFVVDTDNGIVYRDSDGDATWVGGRRAVSVTYQAGWATPPDDVKQAVLEALRHLWTTQRGAMDGRNPFGGDEYASGTGWSLPRRVMELLAPYQIKDI